MRNIFKSFFKKDKRKFAVVSSHFEGVGSVYGPFNSKKEANTWISKTDFPSPENVHIRTLYPPSVLS